MELAVKLGVKQVITFSGCPGGDPKATQPNWITSSWPPEYPQMLEWQWKERDVPYWKQTAKLLKQKGARVRAFVRFEVGEGIEKKQNNFVEEVMAQVKGAR